jgi:mono/diheme cytochrome c family protein
MIRFLFIAILLLSALNAKSNTGKSIYLTRCASCHNQNPSKPGSIGPDIVDSSLELLTLKTQKRQYPVGYQPKRKTRIMPQIKLSDNQLNELYQYINSFVKK